MRIILLLFSILVNIIFNLYSIKQDVTMDTMTVHYHKYDKKYDGWTLWTWLDDYKTEIKPAGKDAYGLIFKLNINNYPPIGNINFVPKYKNWEKKDIPDRYWIRTTPIEIWVLQGIETIYFEKPDTQPFIRKAFLDDKNEITIITTKPINKSEIKDLKAEIELNKKIKLIPKAVIISETKSDSSVVLKLITNESIKINQLPARVYLQGFKSAPLIMRGILDSEEFISNEPLGVFIESNSTNFSVYAPGANKVTLNLYNTAESGYAEKILLGKTNKGIWTKTINKNLIGKYYTYQVAGYDESYNPAVEVIDPYARNVTAHNGRGLIYQDITSIHDSPDFSFKDAIIYEMHVRDFTISENSGIDQKGKYLGFTETGTKLTGTEIISGIDHLVELGINTVQLMPIQDFEHNDSDYFWGYMPVNFNSPDGWFASNSNDDSKIQEFKMLVDALHKKGIKVVLDVVYNHTAEGSPSVRYNFNGLIPNFYYRQRTDGSYWNGSGTGNEMRSEHPMIRRYIIESLKYWVEEYKIDGFRFDLMGLHDMVTMKEIVQTLRQLNPEIFIYGEPWTAGDTPITPTVKGTQRRKGFAVFNDHFRDAMKGPWYNLDPGFLQKGFNVDKIKKGIIGSITDFANSPQEVINYVVCHDGRTLWDHLKATLEHEKNITSEQLKLMDKLASVLLFTSQGVPFIHGGQEFLRSKFGSHNSYNQPDSINMIRWELKQINYDIFEYYQGLINIRKNHPVFKMTNAPEIKKNIEFLDNKGFLVPQNCIAFTIKKGESHDSWNEVLVLLNPNKIKVRFQIPDNNWNVVVDDQKAGLETINIIKTKKAEVNPISALIMYR
jgi:pullulanase